MTDDAGLLRVVTSAKLACGFHAVDEATIRAVCTAAAARGVAVEAASAVRAALLEADHDVRPWVGQAVWASPTIFSTGTCGRRVDNGDLLWRNQSHLWASRECRENGWDNVGIALVPGTRVA